MKIWTGNDNALSVAILDKVSSFNNERKSMQTQKNAPCFENITIKLLYINGISYRTVSTF